MNLSLITLATLKPELREQIEELADLGWLLPVWSLKESVYGTGTGLPLIVNTINTLALDIDRLRYHLELLGFFVSSGGISTEELNRETLLEEMGTVLSTLDKQLDKREKHALQIYQEVYAQVRTNGPIDSSALTLLNLADRCFDIMRELEDVPYLVTLYQPIS